MSRLSKLYLTKRFERVHAAMGWTKGKVWNKDANGNMRSTVGAVFLQKGYMHNYILDLA